METKEERELSLIAFERYIKAKAENEPRLKSFSIDLQELVDKELTNG